MKRMLFGLCLGMLTFLVTAPSSMAQWLYQHTQSAFKGGDKHTLSANNNDHEIRFLCTPTELSFFYLTPDRLFGNANTHWLVNLADPRFLLRVDQNPVWEYPAKIHFVDENAVISGSYHRELLSDIRSAITNISIALRYGGEIIEEQSFSVGEVHESAATFLNSCTQPRTAGVRYAEFWALAEIIEAQCDGVELTLGARLGTHLSILDWEVAKETKLDSELILSLSEEVSYGGCAAARYSSFLLTDRPHSKIWKGDGNDE